MDYHSKLMSAMDVFERQILTLYDRATSSVPTSATDIALFFGANFQYNEFLDAVLPLARCHALHSALSQNLKLMGKLVRPLLELFRKHPEQCEGLWGIISLIIAVSHNVVAKYIENQGRQTQDQNVLRRAGLRKHLRECGTGNRHHDAILLKLWYEDIRAGHLTTTIVKDPQTSSPIKVPLTAQQQAERFDIVQKFDPTADIPYTDLELSMLFDLDMYSFSQTNLQVFHDFDRQSVALCDTMINMLHDDDTNGADGGPSSRNLLVLSQLFARGYEQQHSDNFLQQVPYMFTFLPNTFYNVLIQSENRLEAFEVYIELCSKLFIRSVKVINVDQHAAIIQHVFKSSGRSTSDLLSSKTIDEEYLSQAHSYIYRHNQIQDYSLETYDNREICNSIWTKSTYNRYVPEPNNFYGWRIAPEDYAYLNQGRGRRAANRIMVIPYHKLNQYQIIVYLTYMMMSIIYGSTWSSLAKSCSRSLLSSKPLAASLSNMLCEFLREFFNFHPSKEIEQSENDTTQYSESVACGKVNHMVLNLSPPLVVASTTLTNHTGPVGRIFRDALQSTFGSVVKDWMQDIIVFLRRHESLYLTQGCLGQGALTSEARNVQPSLLKLHQKQNNNNNNNNDLEKNEPLLDINRYNPNNIAMLNGDSVVRYDYADFWDYEREVDGNGHNNNGCNDNTNNVITLEQALLETATEDELDLIPYEYYCSLPLVRLVKVINQVGTHYNKHLNIFFSNKENIDKYYEFNTTTNVKSLSFFLSTLSRFLIYLYLQSAIFNDYYRALSAYMPVINPLCFISVFKHFWTIVPEFRLNYLPDKTDGRRHHFDDDDDDLNNNYLQRLNDNVYQKGLSPDDYLHKKNYNRFLAKTTLQLPYKAYKYRALPSKAGATRKNYRVLHSDFEINLSLQQEQQGEEEQKAQKKEDTYDPFFNRIERKYEEFATTDTLAHVLSLFSPLFEACVESFGIIIAQLTVDIACHCQDYAQRLLLFTHPKLNIFSHILTIAHRYEFQRARSWMPRQWSLCQGLSSNRQGRLKNAILIALSYITAKPHYVLLRHNYHVCFSSTIFVPIILSNQDNNTNNNEQQENENNIYTNSILQTQAFLQQNPLLTKSRRSKEEPITENFNDYKDQPTMPQFQNNVTLAFGDYDLNGDIVNVQLPECTERDFHEFENTNPNYLIKEFPQTLFFRTQDPYLANVQFYNHVTAQTLSHNHTEFIQYMMKIDKQQKKSQKKEDKEDKEEKQEEKIKDISPPSDQDCINSNIVSSDDDNNNSIDANVTVYDNSIHSSTATFTTAIEMPVEEFKYFNNPTFVLQQITTLCTTLPISTNEYSLNINNCDNTHLIIDNNEEEEILYTYEDQKREQANLLINKEVVTSSSSSDDDVYDDEDESDEDVDVNEVGNQNNKISEKLIQEAHDESVAQQQQIELYQQEEEQQQQQTEEEEKQEEQQQQQKEEEKQEQDQHQQKEEEKEKQEEPQQLYEPLITHHKPTHNNATRRSQQPETSSDCDDGLQKSCSDLVESFSSSSSTHNGSFTSDTDNNIQLISAQQQQQQQESLQQQQPLATIASEPTSPVSDIQGKDDNKNIIESPSLIINRNSSNNQQQQQQQQITLSNAINQSKLSEDEQKQFLFTETIGDNIMRSLYMSILFNSYFSKNLSNLSPHSLDNLSYENDDENGDTIEDEDQDEDDEFDFKVQKGVFWTYHPLANLFSWILINYEPKLVDYLNLHIYQSRLPHHKQNIIKYQLDADERNNIRQTTYRIQQQVCRGGIGLLTSCSPMANISILRYITNNQVKADFTDFFNERYDYLKNTKKDIMNKIEYERFNDQNNNNNYNNNNNNVTNDDNDNTLVESKNSIIYTTLYNPVTKTTYGDELIQKYTKLTNDVKTSTINCDLQNSYALYGDAFGSDARLLYGAKWMRKYEKASLYREIYESAPELIQLHQIRKQKETEQLLLERKQQKQQQRQMLLKNNNNNSNNNSKRTNKNKMLLKHNSNNDINDDSGSIMPISNNASSSIGDNNTSIDNINNAGNNDTRVSKYKIYNIPQQHADLELEQQQMVYYYNTLTLKTNNNSNNNNYDSSHLVSLHTTFKQENWLNPTNVFYIKDAHTPFFTSFNLRPCFGPIDFVLVNNDNDPEKAEAKRMSILPPIRELLSQFHHFCNHQQGALDRDIPLFHNLCSALNTVPITIHSYILEPVLSIFNNNIINTVLYNNNNNNNNQNHQQQQQVDVKLVQEEYLTLQNVVMKEFFSPSASSSQQYNTSNNNLYVQFVLLCSVINKAMMSLCTLYDFIPIMMDKEWVLTSHYMDIYYQKQMILHKKTNDEKYEEVLALQRWGIIQNNNNNSNNDINDDSNEDENNNNNNSNNASFSSAVQQKQQEYHEIDIEHEIQDLKIAQENLQASITRLKEFRMNEGWAKAFYKSNNTSSSKYNNNNIYDDVENLVINYKTTHLDYFQFIRHLLNRSIAVSMEHCLKAIFAMSELLYMEYQKP